MKHQRRIALTRWAARLIAGPRSILPPKRVDDGGWLQPDFEICLWHPQDARQSVALFVDNTINRKSGWLRPLLRYVRCSPLTPVYATPVADYALGRPRNWARARQLVLDLHRHCPTVPFLPFAPSMTRDSAHAPMIDWRAGYRVKFHNGIQSFEFSTPRLQEDPFAAAVDQTFIELVRLMQPFDPDGWTERFQLDLGTHDWRVGDRFFAHWAPTVVRSGTSDIEAPLLEMIVHPKIHKPA
jgi:hypothetical protein